MTTTTAETPPFPEPSPPPVTDAVEDAEADVTDAVEDAEADVTDAVEDAEEAVTGTTGAVAAFRRRPSPPAAQREAAAVARP